MHWHKNKKNCEICKEHNRKYGKPVVIKGEVYYRYKLKDFNLV